jgi:hypothetical protein
MHYPVFVYRCPGAHFGPIGTTYESTVANDEKEFSNLLANGWSESLIKAVDTFLSPAKLVEDLEESADNSPITRDELELKAREIGVKFDGRTTDALLLKRIENAIEGK